MKPTAQETLRRALQSWLRRAEVAHKKAVEEREAEIKKETEKHANDSQGT